MNGVLQPFGEPVRRKCDEYNETDDLAVTAPTSSLLACRIVGARREFDIDSCESDREVCGKSRADYTANEANPPYMSMMLRNINRSAQHESAKRNARDPADETEDQEGDKDEENDSTRVVVANEHPHRGDQPEDDIQDAGDPYKLFGEGARKGDIDVAQHKCHAKTKGEENDRARV